MGLDVDYIAGNDAIDRIHEVLNSESHGKREKIVDEIIEFAEQLEKKYGDVVTRVTDGGKIYIIRNRDNVMTGAFYQNTDFNGEYLLQGIKLYVDDYGRCS